MNRRHFLKHCALSFGALSIGVRSFARQQTPSLPNILFILADDMGYGDIQAYNPKSTIPTPHLNRLARENAGLNGCWTIRRHGHGPNRSQGLRNTFSQMIEHRPRFRPLFHLD